MLLQPDLLVHSLLERVLTALRDDTAPLVEVFAGVGNLEEIRTYFQRTKIPIRLGYPRAVNELPGLYVLLGAVRETGEPIGRTTTADDASPLRYYEDWESRFQCTVNIGCWSPNANVAVWTSAVAMWALLGGRTTLQESGLQKQLVSQRDLEPDFRFLPDFVYRRDVVLTAGECWMGVQMEFFRLTGVTVVPDTAAPGSTLTTITMR